MVEVKPSKANGSEDRDDFSYQGRTVSGQYQIYLGDIILTFKKIAANIN